MNSELRKKKKKRGIGKKRKGRVGGQGRIPRRTLTAKVRTNCGTDNSKLKSRRKGGSTKKKREKLGKVWGRFK